MAEQLLVINLSDAPSVAALDASIAGEGDAQWTARAPRPVELEPGRDTIVVFFTGAPDGDEEADYDIPRRLRGPVDSWSFGRIVLAQVRSVDLEMNSMHLILTNVAEEDYRALRNDPLHTILGLIGAYEEVEDLDEQAFRGLLETAARSGVAVFPDRPTHESGHAAPRGLPASERASARDGNSTPLRYLFNRRDFPELRTISATSLAYHVFFQMWQNRQPPFNEIVEGDVVYIGDTETRRIYWEVRVGALLHDGYASTAEALEALWVSYGLVEEDLNDYHRTRPSAGVVLAWAPIVMQPLDVTLPAGQRFGQNGYRRLEESDLQAIGVPPLATGDPLAVPPDTYDPQNWRVRPLSQVSRYIPLHVREAVEARDLGTCVGGCGATVGLHFDHKNPFSRGGEPTVENIRLLCARSNLSKGSRGPDAPLACASD